jgi:hypothetical protein
MDETDETLETEEVDARLFRPEELCPPIRPLFCFLDWFAVLGDMSSCRRMLASGVEGRTVLEDPLGVRFEAKGLD